MSAEAIFSLFHYLFFQLSLCVLRYQSTLQWPYSYFTVFLLSNFNYYRIVSCTLASISRQEKAELLEAIKYMTP